MLESKSLSSHINDEFSFLALSKSELVAVGLLYYEADRMSSLKIVLTLTWLSLGLPIDGNLYVTWTL